jgi:hypothetical protein
MMIGRVTEKNQYHMVVDTIECTTEDKQKQPVAIIKIGSSDKTKNEGLRDNSGHLSDSC